MFAALMTLIIVFMASTNLEVIKESYSPDKLKNPNNPSRGYYVQLDSSEAHKLDEYSKEVRLCLLAYDLYDYRDREIPDEKLNELEQFLQEAKKNNMKCIFRAAYGFKEELVNDAKSMDQIKSHILQIAPILNQYKSEIYVVQAGFLGPWGEWHDSIYLEDDKVAKRNRNTVIEQLLKALDEEIVINIRRPKFIRDASHANLSLSRIGIHNDGLLASDSDYGTYDDENYNRDEELEWMEENITAPQNGGEMPKVSLFSSSKNASKEFEKLKISYLNLKYNEEVLKTWQKEKIQDENAFIYLSQRIGYRYYVSETEFPETFRTRLFGEDPTVKIVLRNEGFASIEDGYTLEIILENEKKEHFVIHRIENLRTLETQGKIMMEIPANKFKGSDLRRIGIRISENDGSVKNEENCVELVNETLEYEGGINFFKNFEDNN